MVSAAHISRFNNEYLLWNLDNDFQSIRLSIKENGILSPITCIEFNNERYILDGYKRYNASQAFGITDVPYITISPDIPISELVFSLQQNRIFSSVLLKIRFLRDFQLSLDSRLCNRFQLPYYAHLKKDVDRILDLPQSAQVFLHQKGFSLKEIVNLLHYSRDVFHRLLADDCHFQFTKRSFDEVLSLTTALMKRHSLSLDQLIETTNYLAIIAKDLTPQQRQKQWLMNLKQDASPVLLASQQKIDRMIADISLPAKIMYDRTLEHAGITIQSRIQTPSDLTELTTALCDDTIRYQLNDVMGLI